MKCLISVSMTRVAFDTDWLDLIYMVNNVEEWSIFVMYLKRWSLLSFFFFFFSFLIVLISVWIVLRKWQEHEVHSFFICKVRQFWIGFFFLGWFFRYLNEYDVFEKKKFYVSPNFFIFFLFEFNHNAIKTHMVYLTCKEDRT